MSFLKEKIISFKDNGFLKIENFLAKEKSQEILNLAKYHLEHQIEPIETEEQFQNIKSDTKTLRRLRQVYFRDNLFKEWMENNEIHSILKEILKDNIEIEMKHHNSIMTKMPYISSETDWHQDIRYWKFSDNNLISIWLALGEENSFNGALEVIPKSHKIIFKDNQFDDKKYFKKYSKENLELIKTKVNLNLKRGDVILFHSKLLHRANKNKTNSPKISFVYTIKSKKTKYLL